MPFSRFTLALVVAACALLGAAAPTTASSGGLNFLVTGNCGQESTLATDLQTKPGVAGATSYDTSAATPTPSDLTAVNVVIDLGDSCGGYADAVTYGNELANYLDHGGVLVQAAYDNWDSDTAHPAGRFLSGGYAPLDIGPNDNSSTELGQVLKPHSPLVQGLDSFATATNTTTPLATGATLLAKWADGRNAIAVKGRVLATSASVDDSTAVPDIERLAINAGKYFDAVPSTKLTRTIINESAGTATFKYKALGTATGFQCELKEPGKTATFKSCPSHKTYKHLKPGSYTFEARAVGTGGVDPTPAKKSFRIKS